MLRGVALIGLCLFAACAGSASPAEPTIPPRRATDSPLLAGVEQPKPRDQEPQRQEPAGKTQQPIEPPALPRPVAPPDPRDQMLHPVDHPADSQQMWIIDDRGKVRRTDTSLPAFATAEQMRAHLVAGLTRQELQFVGFDQVTIAECVDHVVAATLEARRQPDDAQVRSRLSEWNALYLAARREAEVRRTAGAATCLPPVR